MSNRYGPVYLFVTIFLLTAPVIGEDTIKIYPDTQWLVDQDDHPLYYLISDNGNWVSTCYSNCLDNRKPFYVENIIVSSPLNQNDFKIITRGDGTSQIIYKGWPLYSYVGDEKGKAKGIVGLWNVVCYYNFPPY
jgi:predicted lipoprotein with Yx(FWY)xxD motif